MYEKEIEKAQERLNAALTLANKQPGEAINMISDMEKWIDETIPNDIPEYYGVVITYNEVMGDLSVKMRSFVQAENYYKKMLSNAVKLYEIDKTKYDIRLAVAYCKLANNCATNIGCHMIPQTPRLLNEQTQRPFDAGENFFKVAIKILQDGCKKGSAAHLQNQARAINSLATMEAAVGRYKESIAMWSDSVRILKAIYEAIDNKQMALFLGQTLQSMATVCTLYKDPGKSQECIEDSIYVLKEHEEENPVQIGVMIARNYMNLAGNLLMQNADKSEIDETYDKATSKISMVNAIAKGAAVADEVSCYLLSGQYYLATDRKEKGLQQVKHSNELIGPLMESRPDDNQLKSTKQHIDKLLEDNKAE